MYANSARLPERVSLTPIPCIQDDGVDFQVSEDKGKRKAADLGLEHSSFSGQKLQEIIDADIYGVSNVIGLEVRKLSRRAYSHLDNLTTSI